MAVYLVDFENVGSNGLQGVPELCEDERVIVFFSDNADSISIDVHRNILESNGSFEFIKVHLGQRNALDFQLASYLGYLIGSDSEKQYCVISKDCGFKPLIDFWKKNNPELSLSMASSIQLFKNNSTDSVYDMQECAIESVAPVHTTVSRTSSPRQQQKQQSPKAVVSKPIVNEEEVLAVVPEFGEESWLPDIIRFINASQTRADLYNRIRAKFGQDKGCLIYNKVKKFR